MERTTYTYKTVGSCDIKVDVYRPPGDRVPAPVIVYIHGGALIHGSRKHINQKQLEQYLAAGYVVASIDYRLAPESRLPDIIADVQDAFEWIRDCGPGLFRADAGRLGVVGHSAGGYLTLMSGCCVRPRPPRALVAFYGYGDIVGDWYSKPDAFYRQQPLVTEEESGRLVKGPVLSEPYEGRGKEKFYLYCRQQGLWPQEVGGRDPELDPDFFVPYCPVRNVSSDYPPTLLLHGDRDTDVPYQQSVMIAEALARHRVEHQLITIPGGGHGFDGNMDNVQARSAFAQAIDFLNRRLGR
jgi:acetyl esterase/lipase